jgi:predicted RNA-binding Zn-ribbon protein involved in translation (DUF1610 family)
MFEKYEPVILKESSDANCQLEALMSLKGTLEPSMENCLEQDIRSLEAGIAGENRILYELKNSHLPLVVLHDLKLVHNGLTAQIDFLIITQQRRFILECKNLYGDISIDHDGNFIRTMTYGHKKRKEGIYSPITQNQRHLNLIKALLHDSRGTLMNLFLDGDFEDLYRSFVVLANPKTILYDRYAKKETRQKIIRVDQLIEKIKEVNDEKGNGRDKISWKRALEKGEWFLAQHQEDAGCDFVSKYRKSIVAADAKPQIEKPKVFSIEGRFSADTNTSINTPKTNNNVTISEGTTAAGKTAPVCPRCGAQMILRTAKRGENIGNRFYGCSNFPQCRAIVQLDET